MTDPFTIGASVVGVAGVAIQIVQLVTQFCRDWKDAPADVRTFIDDLQVLAQTLLAINANILKDTTFIEAFDGQPSLLLAELGPSAPNITVTRAFLDRCEAHLTDVLLHMKEKAEGHRFGWKRLKEAFDKKHTRESVVSLQRQCQLLNNMIGVDTLTLSAATHNALKVLHREHRGAVTESSKVQLRNHRDDVLEWLKATEYGSQQSDLYNRMQEGTGQWLFHSSEYREWSASTASSLLYCHGMPGAGKTSLTSLVINHLCKQYGQDPEIGIAYVYCDFRRQHEQNPVNLLSSLLKQLASVKSELPPPLEELYARHHSRHTRPSLKELRLILQSMLKTFSQTFILADALDELSITQGWRQEFTHELTSLRNETNINLFLTSRNNMQVAQEIGQDCVRLEVRATDEDVKTFLRSQIHRLPGFVRRNPRIQDDVELAITKAVDGMWVLSDYIDVLG
jgi:hypothetical protein